MSNDTITTRRACKAAYESAMESLVEVARILGSLPFNRTILPLIEDHHLVRIAIKSRIILPDSDGSAMMDRALDRYAFHYGKALDLANMYPTLPKEERGGTGGGRKPLTDDEKAARLIIDG